MLKVILISIFNFYKQLIQAAYNPVKSEGKLQSPFSVGDCGRLMLKTLLSENCHSDNKCVILYA